jgi:hypothetical protein
VELGGIEPPRGFERRTWSERYLPGFIGYFLLSLLFFPLALIMAGFAKDRTGTFAPSHASADSTFVAPP